ncbi:MAG TPA: hypothetical protein DEH78_01800 [Solibacterales bacterium]|nr:hypothetical protein [Bryobacterales bacterium]
MPQTEVAVVAAVPVEGFLSAGLPPAQMVRKNSERAKVLKEVIEKQGFYTQIGRGRHLRLEGWQTLGAMTGAFAQIEWSRRVEGGWEARAVVKTLDGNVIGAAESMCMESERNWTGKEDHAVRSMAQTRALSKALSGPLRFVVALAGFEGTPAEEMPHVTEATANVFPARPVKETVAQPRETTGTPTPPPANPAPSGTAVPSGEALAEWQGLIEKVTQSKFKKKDGRAGVRFTIHSRDGKEFSTFSETFAQDCKNAAEQEEPMLVRYSTNQYGLRAEQVAPVGAGA